MKVKINGQWVDMAVPAIDTLPIGIRVGFCGTKVPDGWLECNGAIVSRTTYKELFEVIGTAYGVGDGSTTFGLPNYNGRVGVGLDTDDTDFDTIGKIGGSKNHTHKLTIGESAYYSTNLSEGGYGVYIRDEDGTVNKTKAGELLPSHSSMKNTAVAGVHTSFTSDGYAVESTGSTFLSSNLSPYIVEKEIIKAYKTTPVMAKVVQDLDTDSTTNVPSVNAVKEIINSELSSGDELILTKSDSIETVGFACVRDKNTVNAVFRFHVMADIDNGVEIASFNVPGPMVDGLSTTIRSASEGYVSSLNITNTPQFNLSINAAGLLQKGSWYNMSVTYLYK